jgi:selenide,water dikinase
VQVLRRLKPFTDPDVLVGTSVPDDAGVYRLRDDLAVIMTVDFFTPIVDDPRSYGEIAATNSLSDVYAMGGEPFAAMNIVAFPAKSEQLPLSVLGEILEGASAKTSEAGVAIIGGHTIDDAEPKFGLAVIGSIHPDAVLKKGGAEPGDRLVLTKPLGTGILTTALKQERIAADDLAEAITVMTTLNRDASRIAVEFGAQSMTDVTGFGLLGHLSEMLRDHSLGAQLTVSDVPVLGGARELAEEDVAPGGTRKNLAGVAGILAVASGVSAADRLLLADAQTSGGLLVAIPPERADGIVARLREAGSPAAAVIGGITDSPGIRIEP